MIHWLFTVWFGFQFSWSLSELWFCSIKSAGKLKVSHWISVIEMQVKIVEMMQSFCAMQRLGFQTLVSFQWRPSVCIRDDELLWPDFEFHHALETYWNGSSAIALNAGTTGLKVAESCRKLPKVNLTIRGRPDWKSIHFNLKVFK